MANDSLIDKSKRTWNGDNTLESINAGSLQRIAAACESMATDRQRMERDLAYYKAECTRLRGRIDVLSRSRNAYKGMVTNLRGRLRSKV